ncbi:MAG: glycerophosphodiester phosphodiesterase [Spirochaetales bacterium]|nr:glycerophosphodiester phosphodiesterase [Spirochaetales bacterium]
MPAFKCAAKMGVDVIETDVHLSRDGEVVIWHDPDLSRVAGRRALISDLDWPELQKIDAGYNFTPDNGKTFPFRGNGIGVALFRDLLREVPAMRLNVDLKSADPRMVEAFARIIEEEKAMGRVIGASFNHKTLCALRRRLPELVTSFSPREIKLLLLRKIFGVLRFGKRFGGAVLQVPERAGIIRVVSRGMVRQAHRAGLRIQVWTVNEEADMKRLLAMGVDGIFTDNPELLLHVVRGNQKNVL